ncbi:hypothetical protein [Williamsia sp. M5A3_1d]
MTTYAIDVYRDDKFWMIRIPELDGTHGLVGEAITQARRVGDVEMESRDYICTVTDSAPSAVDVEIRSMRIATFDVLIDARYVQAERERAQEIERAAALDFARLARNLAAHAVPVRDIGSILNVSYQRAHQLVSGRELAEIVAPAKVAPAKAAPAKVAPAKVAPAKVAPAKASPAKRVAKAAPRKRAVAQKRNPAKGVVAKRAAAKKVPFRTAATSKAARRSNTT